jgi:uncharacterized membrane protein YdjX (TVP38/TMEM64 family)
MSEKRKSGSTLKLVIGGLLVVALVVLARLFDVQTLFKNLLAWVEGAGFAGGLVFVGIYITATVLFVPGSILTLGAGFVFGVLRGTAYVSVASTVGATLAFLVGRYLARDWIAGKVEGNDRFKTIDDAVGREGWKIVGLTRLSPVFPFNLLNYAYGLTKVSLRGYFLASWIGMLPGTLMFVYIGSLASNLATLGGDRSRTTLEWVLYGVGLLATVAVTVFVTKLARQALSRKIDAEEPATEGASNG